MSKKKKKRKNRASRKAANVVANSAVDSTPIHKESKSDIKQQGKKPNKIAKVETTKIEFEDNVYVRADIRKSMLITGVILVAYALLWYLLQYTKLSSYIIGLFS